MENIDQFFKKWVLERKSNSKRVLDFPITDSIKRVQLKFEYNNDFVELFLYEGDKVLGKVDLKKKETVNQMILGLQSIKNEVWGDEE